MFRKLQEHDTSVEYSRCAAKFVKFVLRLVVDECLRERLGVEMSDGSLFRAKSFIELMDKMESKEMKEKKEVELNEIMELALHKLLLEILSMPVGVLGSENKSIAYLYLICETYRYRNKLRWM